MLRPLLLGACVALFASGCATDTAQKQLRAENARPADTTCIRETGTHIVRKDDKCLPVPGRSYSQSDLRGTGRIRTGDAVDSLDP